MEQPKSFRVANARVVLPGEGVRQVSVRVTGGRIAAVGQALAADPGEERVDAAGRLLTPGLIDVHTHGLLHWRYEAGAEELHAAAARLPAFGCTCAFPTLVGRADEAFLRRLATLCAALASAPGARLPGVHLEGPFVALAGAGCATLRADTGLLAALLAAADGRVAAMSVSPEVPGIVPLIERLVQEGVRVFLTHTAADAADTRRAIAAGARHATHFYDVFHPPPERDPGVRPAGCVEAVLADPRVSADFICDGIHVDPAVVHLALTVKGAAGLVLITDSNVGAGLPPGEYDTPWGFRVRVDAACGARIAPPHPKAGALAGSALTPDRGMANLLRWFEPLVPAAQLWALGTLNPARLMGLTGQGVIRPGAHADLVLWDELDLHPVRAWVGGVSVLAQAS